MTNSDLLDYCMKKTGAEQNEICLRRLRGDSTLEAPQTIAKVPAGRLAGIPRLIASDGGIIVAWRDGQVRAAIVPFSQNRKTSRTE